MAEFLDTLTLPEIDIEATVARLRESKNEHDKQEGERGFHEGVEWAKDTAEYGQLRKLAETDLSQWWDSRDYEAGQFAQWLDGLIEMEAPDSLFASFQNDGVYPSDEYADGFVKGASEVWNAVAGQL